MKKSKTRRILIYSAIYFVFLSVGFAFLVLHINNKQELFNNDLLSREHEASTLRISSNLQSDYGNEQYGFVNYVSTHQGANDSETVDNLNDNKTAINQHTIKYHIFGLKTEEGFYVNGLLHRFNQATVGNYYKGNIAVFDTNVVFENYFNLQGHFLVFTYGNIVGLIKAEQYFGEYKLSYVHATHGFIVSKEGIIYYNNTNEKQSLLSQIIGHQLILSDFLNQETRTIRIQYNDKEYYLSSTYLQLENDITEDLYVVHMFERDTVFVYTNSIFQIAVIFIVIALLLIVGAQFIIYKIISTKNADIESSRLLHFYQKPLIIYLNTRGRVAGYNKAFKDIVHTYHDYKVIDDFLLSDELISSDNSQLLLKQQPFDAHFKCDHGDITIRFIPVKKINGYDLIGEDVTDKDLHFKEYRSLAIYHQTTRLPNLSYFKTMLQNKLISKDYLKHKHSIVLLNISNFRNINRLLGEQTADLVLNTLANFLREQLSKGMQLFNTFMDYFLIYFDDITEYQEVLEWVNHLLILMEKPLEVNSSKINLKVKVGIYNFDESDTAKLKNPEIIYQRVMSALNQARNTDKDIVVYDQNIGQYVEYQKQMEFDLREAIDKDEFVLHLQPQYHNEYNKIVSFEALIRWDNPKYKDVSPQVYISLAEANNLIIEIGYLVIKKTFELAKKLEKYDVKISMNVSPVQVLQAGFINDFLTLYDEYKIKKRSIAIEVTETFLMSSFDVVIDKLKILKNHGVDIHLDDFGTGNSSLMYLQELPIDTIKIDRGFIMHLPQDKYSKAIVNMIVALAKTLDLGVIAEGVETDQQNQFLHKAGCHVIQGWLISKARPVDEIIEMLENRGKIEAKDVSTQTKTKGKTK